MNGQEHREKAEKYHRQVEQYRLSHQAEPLTIIRLGSAEWQAWERYFREYLGFEPVVMKRINIDQNKEKAMTVPTQWPEWFDSEYAAKDTQARLAR
jgi:hypothetical protein